MVPMLQFIERLLGFPGNLQLLLGPWVSGSPPPPLHNLTAHPNPSQPCRFMELPPELRITIYAYLLSTKHTMNIEDSKNSWYPTVSTNIQIAILRVSRQIKREAEDVLRKQNLLVLVTSNLIPCGQWKMFARPAIIMKDEEAEIFSGHALAIEFDTRCYSTISRKERHLSEWDRPRYYIVACEDLAKLVRALLIINHTATGLERTLLTECHLEINVLCPLEEGAGDDRTISDSDRSKLRSLLDPLRRLHSVASASINGPIPMEYRNDVLADICGSHIDSGTMIDMTTALEDRGDAFARGGQYHEAYLAYEAAVAGIYHGHAGSRWTLGGDSSARMMLDSTLAEVHTKRDKAHRRLNSNELMAIEHDVHTLLPNGKGLEPVYPAYEDALEHQQCLWQRFMETLAKLWATLRN